ncbi:MAG: hypothetical protein ACE1ZQ_09350 [Ignavibacteriaceae bacterium]
MGLFDFIGDVASAAVKVAITPVAIIKDVVNVSTDKEPTATRSLLESAGEDLESAGDRIMGEK